jgi:hypothetical protein
VPAQGGHGQHGASSRRVEQHSRRAWSKLQEGSKLQVVTVRCRGGEGGEKHLHSALEIPPWHGEAVPVRPRRHRARGSHRRYVDEAPAHQAQTSPWTRPSNSGASSRSPWPRSRASEAKGMRATRKQSSRSHRQAEPSSPDLLIERHLGGGDRQSSSESSTAAAR